jgi:hypothetical protein
VRKVATGWGATDAQAGWAGRVAEAQGGSGRSGRKEEVGRGWAEIRAGPISSNKTLSNFYLEF